MSFSSIPGNNGYSNPVARMDSASPYSNGAVVAAKQVSETTRQVASSYETKPVSEKQVVDAIEKAIKSLQGPQTQLDFSIHEETKQIMVKVKNSETGEIIREIPAEKNLDLLANLWKMAGIIIDEKR